jgi:hypothetical protein
MKSTRAASDNDGNNGIILDLAEAIAAASPLFSSPTSRHTHRLGHLILLSRDRSCPEIGASQKRDAWITYNRILFLF